MHIKLDFKIFLFICIFLLTKKIETYALLMLFGLIHEIGHLICGIVLGLKPDSIKIMPLGFKLLFKTKYKDYNKKVKNGTMISIKRIIIYFAGPLTNIIIAIIFGLFIIDQKNLPDFIRTEVIYCNLLIATFNLIPIYPLDGGKIIHEIIHIIAGLKKCYQLTINITWISISILTAITGILVLYYKSFVILIAISYIWILVIKTQKELKNKQKIFEIIDMDKEVTES